MELERTSLQEWIKKRANAVRQAYTAFTCLNEFGHGEMVVDESTPSQMPCPYHGADNKPSARYYPRSGGRSDYVRCYKCRENWDSINLYAKFRGLRFMDALTDLERRFRIKVLRKPEGPEIVEPSERRSGYVSDKWGDVPRVLAILERKLSSIHDKCGMSDYVKFCRLIDSIQYDYDRTQIPTPDMVQALSRAMVMIDDIASLPDNFGTMEQNGDDFPS